MILKIEFTVSIPDRYTEAMKVSPEYKPAREIAVDAVLSHVDRVIEVYDTINTEK